MNVSHITCTKWHNTNEMVEFTNDINKVFGNADDWFRIHVLSLHFGEAYLQFLTKTVIKLPLTFAMRINKSVILTARNFLDYSLIVPYLGINILIN
jgi:hypothetical protein